MAHLARTVLISAPVEQVFSYVSNWKRWPDWFEGVSEFIPTSTVLKGTGARYAYQLHLLGFSVAVETEIHDFAENRGWQGVATKGMPHRTEWRFEPAGDDRTRFTYTLDYDIPLPFLGPALDGLVLKPLWKGIIRRSLERLKKRFEHSGQNNP